MPALKIQIDEKNSRKLYHKLKGCWTKMIHCLFGFKWFYSWNESVLAEQKKTKTTVNLLNCIYNSFFLYITLTIFVWALFLFSQISKETRGGKQQLRRINPGRCSGDVALQEGHEPPSASVRSFIWQTHQGQETTPCLRPFSRGQEKTRFQTNVPQDGVYPPQPPARQQRGWGGSQTQARDTTGRFTDP